MISQLADHRFFSAMAVACAVAIVTGFGQTYLPKLTAGTTHIPAVIHVHAAVFTAWVAFFVAQAILVLRGNVALHRRLGVAVVLLAPAMLLLGAATAVAVTREGHRGIPGVEFADPGGFLLLNLMAALIFTSLALAGWYFRRDPQTHKRLMLTAVTGALVGPGVSRLSFASGRPGVIAVLVMAFLLAGPAYDFLTRRRVHRAYLWSLPVAVIGFPPVVSALAATDAWRAIASMMLPT